MPIAITSNWPLLVVMSVVARWRSTFSSRITHLSWMSGFAFSNAGDSFFNSIMSGLLRVAIVTVVAAFAAIGDQRGRGERGKGKRACGRRAALQCSNV